MRFMLLKGMQEQEKPLSAALENYLSIIFTQEFAHGACRASDIAKAANVARPTITSALQSLARLGYVEYSPYRLINLTEKGLLAGQKLAHRKMVLQDFFQNILQIPAQQATEVACGMEHVLPDDIMTRLRRFVLFLHHNDGWQGNWENWLEESKNLPLNLVHKARGSMVPPAIRLRHQFVQEESVQEKVIENKQEHDIDGA